VFVVSSLGFYLAIICIFLVSPSASYFVNVRSVFQRNGVALGDSDAVFAVEDEIVASESLDVAVWESLEYPFAEVFGILDPF
jgi:hypothetical protein